MATSYQYQKTIRNPVLGLVKTTKAHTEEELDAQAARQEEIWEREVTKRSGEAAAIVQTQEERQRREVKRVRRKT
jgi:hypothetical protein